MRTDDFLADLELQLRDARAPRDLRPLATVAVVASVALLALAVLAFAPQDRQSTPATPGHGLRVQIWSGGDRAEPTQRLADLLRRQGYQVLPPSHDSEFTSSGTGVLALDARAGDAAGDLRRLLHAETLPRKQGRFLQESFPRAQVVVLLADDIVLPPVAAEVDIVNATGQAGAGERIAAKLRGEGVPIASVTVASPRNAATLTVPPGTEKLADDVERTLELDHVQRVPGERGGDIELVIGRDAPSDAPGFGRTAQIVSPVVDAATERKLTDALESQGYGVAPVIHREPLSRQSNSIVMGLGPEGEKLADALRGSLRGLLQSPGGPEERYVLPETSFPDADVLIWLGELDVTPPEVVDVVDESGGRGRNVREFLEVSGISVRRVEGGHGRVSARTTILWPPGRERFARYVAEALGVDAKLYPTTGLRTIIHLGKDIRF